MAVKKKTPQEELNEACGMDLTLEPWAITRPEKKISIDELLRRGRKLAKMRVLD